MKTFKIKNTEITVVEGNYGLFIVRKGGVIIGDRSKRMYDACDDYDDIAHKYAQEYYYNLFQ